MSAIGTQVANTRSRWQTHTFQMRRHKIAEHILALDHDHEYSEGRGVILEALNAAMIVAHCRPFSGNERQTRPKIPDLPARFLGCLTDQERYVHDVAMNDRHTVVAHSNSEAWDLRPVVLLLGERKILMPWSADARAADS